MDQGIEFGADFQQQCQSRGILPVVTDLETLWHNSVVERHGALFNMAFEKACSLEAPITEAEIEELIEFTFAELNRRVGCAGFSPGQRVFGRQLRLLQTCSRTISSIPLRSRRRCGEARPCGWQAGVVSADRRAMTTPAHSRRRKPRRALVAGEPMFTHRRKDGAQGWCGPGVCVLSEEPKP